MSGSPLQSTPLGDHLGVELASFDPRSIEDERVLEQLVGLLLVKLVVVLRGQRWTPDEQVAFTRHFGGLWEFPLEARKLGEDNPWVFRMSNNPELGFSDVGHYWHTDGYFHKVPPSLAVLAAVTVPPEGGDTLFANMYRACACLPEELGRAVEGRHAMSAPEPGAPPARGLLRAAPAPVIHPLLRPHPTTGRLTLYFNRGNIVRIEDHSPERTEELLEEISSYISSGDFTYRHVWQPGDVVLWENGGTAHRATATSPEHLRIMDRTSVVGDVFNSDMWLRAAAQLGS